MYKDGNITVDLGDLGVQTIPCSDIFGSLVISYSGAGGNFTIGNAETGEVAFAVPCVDVIGIFYNCE